MEFRNGCGHVWSGVSAVDVKGGMRSQKESLRRGEEKEELGGQETSPETARTHLCMESHPEGRCSALTVVPMLVHTFISLKHSILFDSLDNPRGAEICKLAAHVAYR